MFSIGFGPPLWKITRGGTEYRIAMIPLGGFVKPAGEFMSSPDAKGMPDEMASKPPLTRAKVLVAGVLMNFIFAFPFCIIAYFIGINLPAPSVADIGYGSSEWNSTLQKGDIITSLIKASKDGKEIELPIRNHNDYRREIIRLPIGTPVKLKVTRNSREILIDIMANGSASIGIQPYSNVIQAVQPNSAAQKSGLEPGDEIIEINGEFTTSAQDISSAISQRISLLTPLKIRKSNGEIKTITATPTSAKLSKPYYDIGMNGIMPVIVSEVRPGSPAEKAGIQKDDRITNINSTPIESWNKFIEIIKSSAGKELTLTVSRGDISPTNLSTTILVAADQAGRGFVGAVSANTNEIGAAKENSPLTNLGLAYGDRIIKATAKTQKGKSLEVSISALSQLQEFTEKTKDSPIEITVIKNTPTPITQTFTITPNLISERAELGIGLKIKTIKSKYPIKNAIIEGTMETLDLGLLTYQMLKKLFQGQESVKGLAGPIGIIQVSYYMAQEGAGNFLWLLALISINLAILNLLPIPVLDGGTIVFCFIEKIKGSPVSIKAQAIAQYIGIFILLSLVAFTFINDIQRIFHL
jgi:regulator of sigma E protease